MSYSFFLPLASHCCCGCCVVVVAAAFATATTMLVVALVLWWRYSGCLAVFFTLLWIRCFFTIVNSYDKGNRALAKWCAC